MQPEFTWYETTLGGCLGVHPDNHEVKVVEVKAIPGVRGFGATVGKLTILSTRQEFEVKLEPKE